MAEREAVLVVVGLPTSLSGRAASASADMARDWVAGLERLIAVPIELVDERLTTVEATTAMRAAGRSAKQARRVIDQAAAVALLQGFLDRDR
ncbi:MAG: putative pre6S rRNA nuclease [Actinomycetota bacterium]|nr:putative pre6S rRNA nuclease [Actinomycetota bacterium]